MTITFGRVRYPDVVRSPLGLDNPWVKEGAPAIPEAVVWHRMVGNLNGTDQWFHGGNAATAYGVGVGSVDGEKNDGKIFEWIGRETRYYGESSGPVSQPYGDGAAYVAEVGVYGVNRNSKAIEISGQYDDPLTDAARNSIINLTAYWADQRKIPWDSFPIVPGKGRSFVIWHQEITIGSGKICPGPVVMNETPALIERIKQLLKTAQTIDAPVPAPVYAKPLPIDGPLRLFRTASHALFVPVDREFTLIADADQRRTAEQSSSLIGPKLTKGTSVRVLYSVVNEGGQWFVTSNWARIPAEAFA